MCVIYAVKMVRIQPDTVLTELELFHFLHHLAGIVGEEYKQKRSEATLVPYIRVTLQPETIISERQSVD
jgi:hypothetical protein